jgi:hypothetical protein
LGQTTVEEIAEDTKDVEPIIGHQLEERTRLQQVLCDLSKDLSPQAIVARKVIAIDLMIALASRQEAPDSPTAYSRSRSRPFSTSK